MPSVAVSGKPTMFDVAASLCVVYSCGVSRVWSSCALHLRSRARRRRQFGEQPEPPGLMSASGVFSVSSAVNTVPQLIRVTACGTVMVDLESLVDQYSGVQHAYSSYTMSRLPWHVKVEKVYEAASISLNRNTVPGDASHFLPVASASGRLR